MAAFLTLRRRQPATPTRGLAALLCLAGLALAWALPTPARAWNEPLRLDRAMSRAEFHACGLDKLSERELRNLEVWLARNTTGSYPGREPFPVPPSDYRRFPDSRSNTIVESRIAGPFNGWNGNTVFQLSNGQIWQQTDNQRREASGFNPHVTIYPSGSVFKMKVDGVPQVVEVRRLR
ncbi:MAG: hypothetical protein KQJ78_22775 [Deltaproteobacteria bacterium]|nr:hypothetical protein [Deltaproteobacteria bacterium]